MIRLPLLIAILALAACAAPRETAIPSPPADVTATVEEQEPAAGEIPDGINPLTREQEDAVSRTD